MRHWKIIALATATSALMAGTAAAQQADSGMNRNNATASLNVSANVPSLVRLSDLDAIALGDYTGSELTGADSVCAFSNTGNYTITMASQNGSGNEFRLSNGTDALVYNVQYFQNANDSYGGGQQAQPGQSVGTFTSNANSPTCRGGNSLNATIAVQVPADQFVSPGTYSDLLSATISAQ